MSAVYYLKILLLFLFTGRYHIGLGVVEGGTIAKYADAVTRKILMARSLSFEDCGSRYLILYLNISSCNSIPCIMHRGTTVEVNVLFDDDDKNTSYLKHKVHWIINAIKTDAHITPDPCDGDDQCISNVSDAKTYWASVHVNKTLPTTSGTMQWEATNEYNQHVICFKVPVWIT